MQAHVSTLDAFGRERLERAHVLREADRCHHHAELGRRSHVEDLAHDPNGRVHAGAATDDADRHRELDAAVETPVLAPPTGERGVAPVTGGEGVRARFDAAPVVARCDRDGVDAVHDALVVSRSAIRIDGREAVRLHYALGDLCAGVAATRQVHLRDLAGGTRAAAIGEVREDAQVHASPRELLDARRDTLGHRVDRVGAHRFATVDDQMKDDHRIGIVEAPHLDLERAAASSLHVRVHRVGLRQDLVARREKRRDGPGAIR